MKHRILFFLMKSTGYILDKIVYKRKVYFEDKYIQKRKIKGGALLVSNHTSFKDYFSCFFTFFFRKVNVIVGSILYKHNYFFNVILKTIGAIKVDEDKYNFDFINESANYVNSSKLVLVFPEAHYSIDGNIKKFYPSYIQIALKTNCPIIPLYNNGVFSLFKRNRIIIGKPIYPKDYIINNTKEEIDSFNHLVENKIKYLKLLLENKKNNPTVSFRYLFNDIGRLITYFFVKPFLRIKIHYKGESNPLKISNRFLICSNHFSYADPLILLSILFRRRIKILASKDILEHSKIRSFFMKGIGCIPIDKNSFDIDAINQSISVLEKEKALALFPEGDLHLNHSFGSLKQGVGLLSVQTNSPILPIYIKKIKHRFHVFVNEKINPLSHEFDKFSNMEKIKCITDKVSSSICEAKTLLENKYE